MTRVFDVLLSLVGLVVTSPLLLLLLIVGYVETQSPLFRQQRVGRSQRPFELVKLRTMRPETAAVPTHLAPASAVTRLGGVLRKAKLDELPQLWNVLKGDMSLVGPRPCLLTQKELIEERARRGVFLVRPGITGLAQVRGIDMSTPRLLAEVDHEMIEHLTLASYLRLILLTVAGKGAGDRLR